MTRERGGPATLVALRGRVFRGSGPATSREIPRLLGEGTFYGEVRCVRLSVRFNSDVAIVSLSGRFLAGGDGPFLRQKIKDLIEAGTRKLVLDFGDVPYIDSTGLGFLAGARVSAQNAQTKMVLANLNVHVKKILDDVKLSQFFVMADSEEGAIAKAHEPGEGAASIPSKEPKGKKRSESSPDA